jgi:hypothetical protein
MKPSALRPGDEVRRTGGSVVLTFIERDSRRRLSVFQAVEYKGQYGQNDKGLCTVPDYQLSRSFERAHPSENPTAAGGRGG